MWKCEKEKKKNKKKKKKKWRENEENWGENGERWRKMKKNEVKWRKRIEKIRQERRGGKKEKGKKGKMVDFGPARHQCATSTLQTPFLQILWFTLSLLPCLPWNSKREKRRSWISKEEEKNVELILIRIISFSNHFLWKSPRGNPCFMFLISFLGFFFFFFYFLSSPALQQKKKKSSKKKKVISWKKRKKKKKNAIIITKLGRWSLKLRDWFW